MNDIFFKTPENVFAYRVAGILIFEDRILLQQLSGGEGYAIPGGHVSLGETGEDALVREFREELSADIRIERPVFFGEIFIPWDDLTCHQLCMYYLVSLKDTAQIPTSGDIAVNDELDGKTYHFTFRWLPLEELDSVTVYPTTIQPLLAKPPAGLTPFIYRE